MLDINDSRLEGIPSNLVNKVARFSYSEPSTSNYVQQIGEGNHVVYWSSIGYGYSGDYYLAIMNQQVKISVAQGGSGPVLVRDDESYEALYYSVEQNIIGSDNKYTVQQSVGVKDEEYTETILDLTYEVTRGGKVIFSEGTINNIYAGLID